MKDLKLIRNLCLLLLVVFAIGCGGGGGGSAPANVQAFGNILWIESGQGTVPASTVRIGEVAGQTASDGFFNLSVPPGATSLTVTYTPSVGSPVVRTFSFSALNGTRDLGELWIGPASIVVQGRLVDSTTSVPVPGGQVNLAGQSGTSGSDGRFTLNGVAFSPNNTSIFLTLEGQALRTGFFATTFGLPTIPVGGVLDVGDVAMVPTGTTDPPPLPFNVRGVVSPTGGGSVVEVLSGATPIRTVTADTSGNYSVWIPEGTYTIRATSGTRTGSTSVTITDVGQVVTVNVTLN
ncbi:MAG: carboxypeptidase-like regulatory domain-containing protein [Fimbriimonadaceae bacterium]|jgi:hypothetical protein|nr:carboxypeptidase-like regulatory domain-containing protein [Fimbriimonadaceae bacterium]